LDRRYQADWNDGALWSYGYNDKNEVLSGRKFKSGTEAQWGYDFAYDFDGIGNRESTSINNRVSIYTANALNQYTQRTVPGWASVLGEVDTTAKVTVAKTTVKQQGGNFFAEWPVDNNAAPVYQTVKTYAAKAGAGTAGKDLVVKDDQREVYVPKATEAFTYDGDGNLLTDGRWTYTWDAENRLIKMLTTTTAANAGVPRQELRFGYDWKSRRISKEVYSVSGTVYTLLSKRIYVYNGWNLVYEIDAKTTPVIASKYVWGMDASGSSQGAGGVGGLIASYQSVSNILTAQYPLYDGNYNINAYINAAGTETARYEYGPFGESLRITGTLGKLSPFRFSTKYTDDESGLVYYGYRYYAQSLGRWINRDPIGERGGINLYTMVKNQIINDYDILGLSGKPTKNGGAAQIRQSLQKLQQECDCCVDGSKVNKCKDDAQAIVSELANQWEKYWGKGPVDDNKKGSDSVGGYMCWDWANIFSKAAKSVRSDIWKNEFRMFKEKGSTTLHFAVEIRIKNPLTSDCNGFTYDDGYFDGSLTHGQPCKNDPWPNDPNWPEVPTDSIPSFDGFNPGQHIDVVELGR
jgi:RHS repeat-associated protein